LKIFDAHCDTICALFDNKKSIFENDISVDIKRMKRYNGYTQVFAAFSDTKHLKRILARDLELFNYILDEIEKYKNDIVLCRKFNDIKVAQKSNKVAALLALEGADAITSVSILRMFYKIGVRIISPTWNQSNHIATSIADKNEDKGLSQFGRIIFAEMNNLGIIADVSHASDKTFWDILELSKRPIIATHSNSRKVARYNRNLTDMQFKALVKTGGCTGINLYPFFLTLRPEAAIKDIIAHIEHFCSLGGENSIGLGCDFDGVDILPKDILGVEDVWKIFNELSLLGYSEELIKKISFQNFERVMETI